MAHGSVAGREEGKSCVITVVERERRTVLSLPSFPLSLLNAAEGKNNHGGMGFSALSFGNDKSANVQFHFSNCNMKGAGVEFIPSPVARG